MQQSERCSCITLNQQTVLLGSQVDYELVTDKMAPALNKKKINKLFVHKTQSRKICHKRRLTTKKAPKTFLLTKSSVRSHVLGVISTVAFLTLDLIQTMLPRLCFPTLYSNDCCLCPRGYCDSQVHLFKASDKCNQRQG